MKIGSGYRKRLGSWGENLALEWLEKKGYQLVQRNIHSRFGEIDLLMLKDGQLIAVEVKTRRSTAFGYGEASVTSKKRASVNQCVQAFLMDQPFLPDSWQLDVVVIELESPNTPLFHHYENVGVG